MLGISKTDHGRARNQLNPKALSIKPDELTKKIKCPVAPATPKTTPLPRLVNPKPGNLILVCLRVRHFPAAYDTRSILVYIEGPQPARACPLVDPLLPLTPPLEVSAPGVNS